MGSVGECQTSGSRTGKQSVEYPSASNPEQSFPYRSGDVQLRVGNAISAFPSFMRATMSPVGSYSRDWHLSLATSAFGKGSPGFLRAAWSQLVEIEISFLGSPSPLKSSPYLLPLDVDGRYYDVTWFEMHRLQDRFAQVGLYNINAPLHQKVQSALF